MSENALSSFWSFSFFHALSNALEGKKQPLLLIALMLAMHANAQQPPVVETSDIDHFWKAYDKLPNAKSKEDSIQIMRQEYMDKASPGFKKFISLRKFTAEEYVALLGRYPRYWRSIRPATTRIAIRKNEVREALRRLSDSMPHFKMPEVYFAIGCLRSGGTTTKNMVLIGAEIAAADSSIDKSELKGWLKAVVGNNGDIIAMVAHESIHTQQSGFPFFELFALLKHKKLNLLNTSLVEGSSDFITDRFLGLNINRHMHDYGNQHRCSLFEEFLLNQKMRPYDFSAFLYNGNNAKDRPADLGYYMGYKIAEEYYNGAANKEHAIRTLLKRGKYKKVFSNSQAAIEASCR